MILRDTAVEGVFFFFFRMFVFVFDKYPLVSVPLNEDYEKDEDFYIFHRRFSCKHFINRLTPTV